MRPLAWEALRDYDVEGNGDSILAIEPREPPRPQLVLNWFTELQERVPTD